MFAAFPSRIPGFTIARRQRTKANRGFLSSPFKRTSIHYLFHPFGNNPRGGRPLVLRTLTAPCRWETLGSSLDVFFLSFPFFFFIYIYIFPIEISHDFILPYSTPFPPWSGYVGEREESLRTLRNEATGDNATWMDISGPRERNYDRLFTSRLRFEPYFSPSISRRRSSRAQYEVTGEGAYEARICIVRRRVGRWFADADVDEWSGTVSPPRPGVSFRCQRSLLVNHSPLSSPLSLAVAIFGHRIKRHRQAGTTRKRWSL